VWWKKRTPVDHFVQNPLDYFIRELEKAFGKGFWGDLSFVARHYENQNQIVVTVTGRRKKEQRNRIVAIVLRMTVSDYEKLKHSIETSVVFPYPITLPPLT
jgi:hypothetical protein